MEVLSSAGALRAAFTRREFARLGLGGLAAALCAGFSARQAAARGALTGFDAGAKAVRTRFRVPGMAIAIIHDGQVEYLKGFGVRDLADRDPVDADTLFCLASNTKPFTGTCLAILEDEGKLSSDDLVTARLPDFRMADPRTTGQLRIKDLLAHKSGLGPHAGDLLYYPPTTYTLAEVVARIARIPIAHPFGAQFAYENLLYAVAAQLIEKVSGLSYREFVQRRIFEPLGMTRSRIDAEGLRPQDNVATGYRQLEDGKQHAVEPLVWKNNPGAGGIYSTARDMVRWMKVHLDGGRLPGGQRLFSLESQRRMWSPGIDIPIDAPAHPSIAAAQPTRLSYGAGWFLSDYRGKRLVWHTGEFPGFACRMTLLPESKLGVLVLTNQETDEAFEALTYDALDACLALPSTAWLEAFWQSYIQKRSGGEKQLQRRMAQGASQAKAIRPLSFYCGRYEDPWYGFIEVRADGGKLAISFSRTPALVGSLEFWREDMFLVHWNDRALMADAFISFMAGGDNQAASASIHRISPFTSPAFDFEDLRLTRPA